MPDKNSIKWKLVEPQQAQEGYGKPGKSTANQGNGPGKPEMDPANNKPAARHQFKVPGGLIISNIQLIQNFYFLIVTVLVGLHVE